MAWQRVTLIVPGREAELLSDALEAEGAISTDLADADADSAEEREIFAEPGAQAAFWERCRLTALFPEDRQVREVGVLHGCLDRPPSGTKCNTVPRSGPRAGPALVRWGRRC